MKNKASELTKKEKSALLQGTDFMYTHGVPRLGIPPLAMAQADRRRGQRSFQKRTGNRIPDGGVRGVLLESRKCRKNRACNR